MTKKRVAIITGVSSGIGLATAQLLSSQGWIVVGTIREKHGPVELETYPIDFQQVEMTSSDDLKRVVESTVSTYGRIDALVNNAGYGQLGPVGSLDYDKVDRQIKVNFVAAAELTRLILPVMKKRKRGVILSVSSIAGRVGLPGFAAYSASKFALEGFMESLAAELVHEPGIRVKIIEPSTVNTPFWARSQENCDECPQAALVHKGRSPKVVARVILEAINSESPKLRYPIGLTQPTGWLHRLLPQRWFAGVTRKYIAKED